MDPQDTPRPEAGKAVLTPGPVQQFFDLIKGFFDRKCLFVQFWTTVGEFGKTAV